jgi:hypothetical protein
VNVADRVAPGSLRATAAQKSRRDERRGDGQVSHDDYNILQHAGGDARGVFHLEERQLRAAKSR